MTVSTTTNKITYSGDGATTSFAFSFPGVAASDLQIYYTDTSGNITLLSSSSYTVVLNAAVSPNPTGIGGTVTYPTSGSPIAVGTKLTILRTLPFTQTTSLSNQGVLYQPTIEAALDYIAMVAQQLNELLGRQLTVAVSDSTPTALPSAAQRANLYLGFDSSGNPIAVAGSTSTNPVSSAMTPVVSAATLAASRTAYGLGATAVEGIGSGLQDDGAGNLRVNNQITTVDSVNQSVTSSFASTNRVASSAITYTLARANTLWNGFSLSVFCEAQTTFACNAADSFGNLAAGTSIIGQPGTYVRLTTDAAASGIWYVDTHFIGCPMGPGVYNGLIKESHAVNACTVAIKTIAGNDPSSMDPVIIAFRNSTAGNGGLNIRLVTAALSITITSGATLGFASGTNGQRFWVFALDNAGAVEVGVVNCRNGTNIYPLGQFPIITTTAMDATADNAATPYSTTARTSVPYVPLGYMTWETGLTTAGTWDASPTRVQEYGWSVPLPGNTVQTQGNITGAFANGTTVIPRDDTIPQITEGDQYMTQAITPTSSANVLSIEAKGQFVCSADQTNVAIALFQDATANALTVGTSAASAATRPFAPSLVWDMLAGTTSSTTFRIRGGADGAGTTGFNGLTSAGRAYGGVFNSYLRVREVMA